jgi:hypothetical protein
MNPPVDGGRTGARGRSGGGGGRGGGLGARRGSGSLVGGRYPTVPGVVDGLKKISLELVGGFDGADGRVTFGGSGVRDPLPDRPDFRGSEARGPLPMADRPATGLRFGLLPDEAGRVGAAAALRAV